MSDKPAISSKGAKWSANARADKPEGNAETWPSPAAVEPTRVLSVEEVEQRRLIACSAIVESLCASHELLRAQLAEATRDRDELRRQLEIVYTKTPPVAATGARVPLSDMEGDA